MYYEDDSSLFYLLPRELVISIIIIGSRFTIYVTPFDELGILSYLRKSSSIPQIDKENIIEFDLQDSYSTYFRFETGQIESYISSQSASLEILGRGL